MQSVHLRDRVADKAFALFEETDTDRYDVFFETMKLSIVHGPLFDYLCVGNRSLVASNPVG